MTDHTLTLEQHRHVIHQVKSQAFDVITDYKQQVLTATTRLNQVNDLLAQLCVIAQCEPHELKDKLTPAKAASQAARK